MSFCTLNFTCLCLLGGQSLTIPPLNRIFPFSDTVSFKEINCLPLPIRLFLNDTRCTQVLSAVKILRTSCFFKSQSVMTNGYYGVETLYQTFFLTLPFYFSTCEYVLSKGTGNSDSQNDIRDSRKYR